jgi:CubicO group peptidase (beta-lactamase class C family)
MKKLFILPLIAGLLVSYPGVLSAQDNKGDLNIHERISYEMEPDGSHQFTLELEQDQFVLLKLMQRGMDLLITTFDPAGDKMEDFDSPNGKNGPEYITLLSDAAGRYGLVVKPLIEGQEKGAYDLEIIRMEAKAVTREGQVDQLFVLWDNQDTPGAAVSVVKDGEIVYAQGYGMANLEYDIPITPATIFHIASVSKQFTAFAILLLERDGKLQLDDDIRTYIPEVPDFGKTITLRHLANHTSGLRDQWNLLALAGWRLDDVITREHILKLVSHQKELNFDPGEEYLYCNTGFTLLAEVVARVSGQSFARFTDERIFKPLHMDHTLFYDDHERIVKNRAYSYSEDSAGYKKSVLSYANVGATSLFTTVEDLSLWALNFEDPVVGDAGMVQKMQTRAVLNKGDTINYALGQSLLRYKGLKGIGHGGADAGYRTQITRFPDQRFSVIVFSNLASFNPSAMANKITDLYLADELLAGAPEVEKPEEEQKEGMTGISIDPDTLMAYAGDFELQPGFIIKISLEGDVLVAQPTGQEQVKLEPVSTWEFKVAGVDARVSFHRDSSDQVSLMKLYQGEQILTAPRLEPFDPEEVDVSEFTGTYYSDELSTGYEFVVEDGKLLARHQRNSDIRLTPVKEDVFSGDAWFFGQTEFIRDDTRAITGCRVSSGRVRNLHFQKVVK